MTLGQAAPALPHRQPPRRRNRLGRPGWLLAAVATAIVTVAPIAMLATSVLRPNTAVWRQQWDTRLPHEIVATLVLVAGVGTLSVVLGGSLAWLVSAYRFPGRRFLSWALVLPLAMPGYILGFVTTSVFGVAGPVQMWWRDRFGRDAWFPEIRSMTGAIVTLSLTLYPYVYLMVRAALRDQASGAYLVARTLGASRAEATRRVVLPMLRPAIAAGAAVVVMETLTDFGTVQYFNVETVTVGVFRIWRGTYDRDAASEIATLVLVFAVLAIGLERMVRGRARFGESGGRGAGIEPSRLTGWRGVAATSAASTVVAVAFAAPTLRLVTWAIHEQRGPRGTPMLRNYPEYLYNSLVLTAFTVGICLVVSVTITNARRFGNPRLVGVANRLSAIGYAVPGPVVGMGVVLALVAVDAGTRIRRVGSPGLRRDRVVRRARVRVRGPLPRAGHGHGRVRPCPGARGGHRVSTERSRHRHERCCAGSTYRCRRRASWPPPSWSGSTPSRSCRSPTCCDRSGSTRCRCGCSTWRRSPGSGRPHCPRSLSSPLRSSRSPC